MKATQRWCVILALAPLLGGCCAAFRAGHLPRITGWPPGPPAEAEKLRSVAVAFSAAMEAGRWDFNLDPRSMVVFRNATYWAYYRAGRFTHVLPAEALADLTAKVRLTEVRHRAPLALRVARMLTFGLVPTWERRHFTLTTTVHGQNRKELGKFEMSESVTTWSQLMLVLVYPFAPPPGVAADCIFDLNRATVMQGIRQGIY